MTQMFCIYVGVLVYTGIVFMCTWIIAKHHN